MNRNVFVIIMAVLSLSVLFGCGNDWYYPTKEHWDVSHEQEEYEKHMECVEDKFRQMVLEYSDYDSLFYQEKEKWENYHEAVRTVVSMEDNTNDWALTVTHGLDQSVSLREASLYYGDSNTQMEDLYYTEIEFTQDMIEDAYETFLYATKDRIDTIGEDGRTSKEYQAAIINEKTKWDEWMNCRATVSKDLPEVFRLLYDGNTNYVKRAKLHQLKNQNMGLGVFNDEVWRCLLPKNCSDESLLEYPGFSVVWDKHCSNLNWYPDFDYYIPIKIKRKR